MASKFSVSALSQIRHVTLNETQLRAHVMRRPLVGIVSRNLLDDAVRPERDFPFAIGPHYRFDVAGFREGIHAALKDQVAGYVLQLRQHGATLFTLAWNFAKTPADGAESWAHHVRMHVASCSKFITAIAMTSLLNERRMSYDTPIAPFLPTYWPKGPNIGAITFRHLLTHTSGFPAGPSDSDFLFMKQRVADGVTAVGGAVMYQNMNFGLCRILIPTILGTISPGAFGNPFTDLSNDALWDYITLNAYAAHIRDTVFAPAGVTGPALFRQSDDALAYPFPAAGNGWDSGDLTTASGGVGWHMSVDDLLAIMGTLRRGGTIMSAAEAQAMLDNGFGCDEPDATPLGTLYRKGGYWSLNNVTVEQSHLYFLPLDMELAVLVNSPIGSGASLPGLVTAAYLSRIYSDLSLRQFFERRILPVSSSVHTVIDASRSVRQMMVR